MTERIRLYSFDAGEQDPRRLVPFAGRHLGEREFDLLQAYADERLAPLLRAAGSGILNGLEVSADGSGADAELRIGPGLALAGDGRLVALDFPLKVTWEALLDLHRRAGAGPPGDGFWYLTLRRAVEEADAGDDREPCRRTEPDPLRDSRLETVALPGLAPLSYNGAWMQMDAIHACNQLCVYQLRHDPEPEPGDGAVPLAVVKVQGAAPVWLEPRVGRIGIGPDGRHRAFLAHARAAMATFARWQAEPPELPPADAARITLPRGSVELPAPTPARFADPRATAPTRLPEFRSVAMTPAARTDLGRGLLPTAAAWPGRGRPFAATPRPGWRPLRPPLLPAAAGPPLDALAPEHNPGLIENGGNNTERSLPALLGLDYLPAAGPFPEGLIQDLGGEPAAGFATGDLQLELTAAPASVIAATIERELPRGVVDLVNLQHERVRVLVAVADPDYRPDLLDLPQIDPALIEDLYQRAAKALETDAAWRHQWQLLYRLDAKGNEDIHDSAKPAAAPAQPVPPDTFLHELLDLDVEDELPEAYQPPPEYDPPPFVPSDEEALYNRRDRLQQDIDKLEDELEENFDLIEALNGFTTLQRQQIDTLTISFTSLAGGTPGDGSGLNLMRWTNYTTLQPWTAPSSETT